MEPIPIPEEAAAGRPYCVDISMGPPPGVSDEDCGTVHMLREPRRADQPLGPAHYAYFRPTPDELAQLNAGGFLELALCGGTVQPFSLAVWPGGTRSNRPTVEHESGSYVVTFPDGSTSTWTAATVELIEGAPGVIWQHRHNADALTAILEYRAARAAVAQET